jgi:DNA-directed RNA polymerase specialized sigma24 family protein
MGSGDNRSVGRSVRGDLDLREQLDEAIGHGPPLPPPERRLAAGRGAVRRRRMLVAAGAATAVAAVVLRYWVGLSVAETAADVRISEGTVKSQAHRGLAALPASTLLPDG